MRQAKSCLGIKPGNVEPRRGKADMSQIIHGETAHK